MIARFYPPVIPRVALVTGAARRIGAEIARELHRKSINVALHYHHSEPEARALAAELNGIRPGSAILLCAALANESALADMVAQVVDSYGRLDFLVNNASSFFPTEIGKIDGGAWDDLLASNLRGPLFLAQAAAPHLRQTGGAIVNITDIHAERPLRGFPVYSTAKGGLISLTRALAVELAPDVRVNAVSPGAILWPAEEGVFNPQERQRILDQILLQRQGRPDEIASTVSFLLLDGTYITGQVINVDGGRSCYF